MRSTLVCCFALLSLLVAADARPATYTITTLAEDTANNGNCTLREALLAASTDGDERRLHRRRRSGYDRARRRRNLLSPERRHPQRVPGDHRPRQSRPAAERLRRRPGGCAALPLRALRLQPHARELHRHQRLRGRAGWRRPGRGLRPHVAANGIQVLRRDRRRRRGVRFARREDARRGGDPPSSRTAFRPTSLKAAGSTSTCRRAARCARSLRASSRTRSSRSTGNFSRSGAGLFLQSFAPATIELRHLDFLGNTITAPSFSIGAGPASSLANQTSGSIDLEDLDFENNSFGTFAGLEQRRRIESQRRRRQRLRAARPPGAEPRRDHAQSGLDQRLGSQPRRSVSDVLVGNGEGWGLFLSTCAYGQPPRRQSHRRRSRRRRAAAGRERRDAAGRELDRLRQRHFVRVEHPRLQRHARRVGGEPGRRRSAVRERRRRRLPPRPDLGRRRRRQPGVPLRRPVRRRPRRPRRRRPSSTWAPSNAAPCSATTSSTPTSTPGAPSSPERRDQP